MRYGVPVSIFRKKDIRTSAWKPWSLRSPFLGSLAILSLGFLICIELLRERSARSNGLAFYKSSDDISTRVFIAYNYIPTVLGTLFGILWSIVDLDAKRLEPYTQISDPHRPAFPFSLLFLDYAFEPAWKVPYLACRRRHWTIAITSTMFLITAIFLAPMQSALFGLTPVSQTLDVSVEVWPQLPSLDDQAPLFTGESVNQANSILLNNASLPAFATEEYAMSPLTSMPTQGGNDETWNMVARVYWSEVSCLDVPAYRTPPQPVYGLPDTSANSSLTWEVHNITLPEGATGLPSCQLSLQTIEIDAPGMQAATYPTWSSIAHHYVSRDGFPSAFDVMNCTNFPFLASLYALDPVSNGTGSSDVNYNAIAIAAVCKVNYFFGVGNVTMLSNGSVLSINLSQDEQPTKLNGTLLDINNLESSISDPMHSNDLRTNATYSRNALRTFVDKNPITMSSVLEASLSNTTYLDRTAFIDSIIKSYKLVFALSIAKALSIESTPHFLINNVPSNTTSANISGTFIAISVSQGFAIASEFLLCCAAMVALFDYCVYYRRRSLLRHDPDSLAALLAFINFHFKNSEVLRTLNPRTEITATLQLKQLTVPLVCQLSKIADGLSFEIRRMVGQQSGKVPKPSSEKGFYQRVLGLVMLYGTMLLTIVAATVLWAFAYKTDFTYLADSNSFASQALWQFTPTLAATCLGAIWAVVHRDLSVIEPWVDLTHGASTAMSLSANYASRTPYVVMIKALKKPHMLLSSISLVCASTAILNISMGGLFAQSISTVQTDLIMTNVYGDSLLPNFATWNTTAWPLADVFEQIRTNVTDNTPVMPWSALDMYFLKQRFPAAQSTQSSSVAYNITTIGIGASLECRSGGSNTNISSNLAFGFNSTSSTLSDIIMEVPATMFEVSDPGAPGFALSPAMESYDDCYIYYGSEMEYGTATIFMGLNPSIANGNDTKTACNSYVSVLDRVWESESNNTLYGILCWPALQAYNVTVVLDEKNLVQDYSIISALNSSSSPFANLQEHLSAFHIQLLDANSENANNDEGTLIDRYNWLGLLTARLRDQTPGYTNSAQNTSILAHFANYTYAQSFASFWALYSDDFLTKASPSSSSSSSPSQPSGTGTASYQISRMEPSTPAFAISLSLLVLYVAAATILYIKRRQQVVPRMPISLGTILPWVVYSRILNDFTGTAHLSSSLRDEYLKSLAKRYRFGWFRDELGIVRLGLEDERFVFRRWVEGERRRPHRSQIPLLAEREVDAGRGEDRDGI